MTIYVIRFAIQKHLLIFLLPDDIVDWALITLSTTCSIEANLGETLNTHFVLFHFPPDMMQVSKLIVHLGLGSELIDWYRGATSVPYNHLLIDLSPRTDNRLRYCTDTAITSKFYMADRLILLDDEHIKFLYSPSVPNNYPQMQKSFPSVWPKRVYYVPLRMHSESSQGEPAKHEKTSPDKISKRSSIALFKRRTWKQRRNVLAFEKRLQSLKVVTPPVINRLFWYGAVCSHPCLCVQQQEKVEYSGSYKIGASKIPSWTES